MAFNNDPEPEEPGPEPAPTTSATDASLSLNAMLELLTHHHRREMLRYLGAGSDGATSLDAIVTHLVEKETEWMGTRPAHNEIETQLHHVHLPKLTATGIIEYDARSKELRYWGHDGLEGLLDELQSFKKG